MRHIVPVMRVCRCWLDVYLVCRLEWYSRRLAISAVIELQQHQLPRRDIFIGIVHGLLKLSGRNLLGFVGRVKLLGLPHGDLFGVVGCCMHQLPN